MTGFSHTGQVPKYTPCTATIDFTGLTADCFGELTDQFAVRIHHGDLDRVQ